MFREGEKKTKTKIIATVGPSSDSIEKLRLLVKAGSTGFRLNYSHGDFTYFKDVINKIRKVEEETETPITIMGDLQGPTIRLGELENFIAEKRDIIKIVLADKTSEKNTIPIPEEKVFEAVGKGDIILVDDGKIEIEIVSKGDGELIGKVVRGGEIRSKVTVAVREKEIDLPILSDRDLEYIEFSINNDVDLLAVSFVRSKEDLVKVKSLLKELGGEDIRIYSKIETASAIRNLDSIIIESDGILIARGDLGSYFPLERIPKLQSLIIEKCLFYGKPSILATQILESMITHPIPTRAEITDIYIGVMEGVDAMLLSGETAIGEYPIESVEWLHKAIVEAENFYEARRLREYKESVYDKFVKGIVFLAEEMGAKIVAYTKEGETARRISRYRPRVDVIVFTNKNKVLKHINMFYGIYPFYVSVEDIKEALEIGKRELMSLKILRKGDIIIKTAGLRRMTTDRIEVEEIK